MNGMELGTVWANLKKPSSLVYSVLYGMIIGIPAALQSGLFDFSQGLFLEFVYLVSLPPALYLLWSRVKYRLTLKAEPQNPLANDPYLSNLDRKDVFSGGFFDYASQFMVTFLALPLTIITDVLLTLYPISLIFFNPLAITLKSLFWGGLTVILSLFWGLSLTWSFVIAIAWIYLLLHPELRKSEEEKIQEELKNQK